MALPSAEAAVGASPLVEIGGAIEVKSEPSLTRSTSKANAFVSTTSAVSSPVKSGAP